MDARSWAIYTHLFDDDHAETMAALEAMNAPVADNVLAMRRQGSLRVGTWASPNSFDLFGSMRAALSQI